MPWLMSTLEPGNYAESWAMIVLGSYVKIAAAGGELCVVTCQAVEEVERGCDTVFSNYCGAFTM